MLEQVAAQIRDDPFAERHHEVVANAGGDREHRDDADHRAEIGVHDP